MNISILSHSSAPPIPFANSVVMTIRSFRGHADVDVHLFVAERSPAESEGVDWTGAAAPSADAAAVDLSKTTLLEAFTDRERDIVVGYLKEVYSTRLTAIRSTPLNFPVPAGLSPLSTSPALGTAAHVNFAATPSYSLNVPLQGIALFPES